MKRKKDLLKKFMGSFMAAVVTITAIPSGTLLGSRNLAYAETDQKNVDTEQTYVGDFNLYEYRADIYLKEDTICNRIIQNMMYSENMEDINNKGIIFPSQKMVNYLDNQSSFKKKVIAWKAEHFVTSPSEILNGGMDEKGYYTAIILSVFKAETTDEKYILNNVKDIESNTNKMFSTVKKWVEESDQIMLDSISKNQIICAVPIEEQKKIQEYFKKGFKETHPVLNNSSEFLNEFDDIFNAVKTIGEAVELMECYIRVMEMSDNMKAVLTEMYKQCPTSNLIMKAALHEATLASENFNGAIGVTLLNTVEKETKDVLSTLLNTGWKKLIEKHPYSRAFMTGAEVGTWLGDFVCSTLFSTDKTIEQYQKMKCLNEFNALLKKVLTSMGNTYLSNKSTQNAANYFAAIDALFSAGDLSCKFASDYAKILYEDSSIGLIWTKVFNIKYDDYINDVNAIQKYYKDEKEDLISWYLNELKNDYPEIYEILMGYDESEPIAVTGVKFDYDELTIGLEDTFSIGVTKPIITPKNAANQNIIYTSSNTEILQIDKEGGWITPKNVGTVTVTATSVDGRYTDSIIVNVIEGTSGLLSAVGSVDFEIKDSGKYGKNLEWTLYKNGTLVISGTGIIYNTDYNWYYYRNYISKVILSQGVTSIGPRAFSGYSSLMEIEIPNSVTSISGSAFSGCSSLEEIKIPNSVTFIGGWAFNGCSSLKEIKIPNSVISIGEHAFYECSSLTKIEIPNSVTSIEMNTFDSCSSLEEIEIPNSVIFIGNGAFNGCSNLQEIKIPNSVTSISGSAFSGCSSLEEIEIPNGVTEIGYSVFNNCNSLKKIKIPSSVTSIGYMAFQWCSSLTGIEIPNSVTSIASNTFYGCSSLTEIEIPNSVISIGDNAFRECSSLTKIEISNSVTSIGVWAFDGCSSLTEIEIPNSVTSIGSDAFGWHAQLLIKGTYGSYAEQYAKSNNIPFQYIHTISSNSDISASYDSEEANINMKLWSKLLGEEDSAYQNINLSNKIATENILPQDVKFEAYEIVLTDESETPIQPEGIMTVKIPVPQGYQGEACKVYYVKDDGNMVNMNAWYEEGYLLFETDHFSTYLITETELKEQSSVIYGDINNDGDVDSKDAVLLKKHLAGYTGLDIDKTAADVNEDGNIDSKDAVRLLRHLAGYEVILGE